ncbi:hypothetical protein Goarm_014039 [Gossypium armourianum]|uniref:Pectate lyase N-terminal domain-containing protein n=1 Tax=Gossypium armourianum TaxID=34283 RepID=A0A7J9J4U9_9ROSI|nr:hypothetical protein [Gossypium armourianum]
MEVTKLRLVFLFSFSTLISRLWANVAEFDDFWKQHEMQARKLALKAYEPSPENITNQLNYNVNNEKTIDGRRANVHIAYGCSITLQFVHNVIIHNIHVHHVVESHGGLIRDSEDHFGFRTIGDGDGISIFGSSNIWLDRISLFECQDLLIDAI